ncbi:MAG TPA: PPOX class F420-dependent oxidoreductase [Roseiflexaceae bacterium]|nr:PPOX class F420-dependent oxidoreductase [Roseiflexaceae bacterium]
MSNIPTSGGYFDALRNEAFIVLTSYRRNGEAVPTTVWFAELDGKLVITTRRTLGKVKRIGANPQVLIAPSDRIGNVHGSAIAARARLLPDEEGERANAALHRKYGDHYVAITSQTDAGDPQLRVFLELAPPEG